MEAISQKTVSIEFSGKKYVLTDSMTLQDFLSGLEIPDAKMIILKTTKTGFVLDIK